MTDVPFRQSRLITARLLHDILRLGHFPDLPFMQSVEILIIITAIFLFEDQEKPVRAVELAKHLGMPHQTLSRRLSLMHSKEMVIREWDGTLRVNPQMFHDEVRDRNIRHLRQLLIEAGIALTKAND